MKYRNIILLLVIFALNNFLLFGQEEVVYDISMEIRRGVGPYRYCVSSGTIEKNILGWKGFPQKTDSLMIFSYNLPTLFAGNNFLLKSNSIYIISYIYNGVKTVICDTNGDKDFTNETKYEYLVSTKKNGILFDTLPDIKIIFNKSNRIHNNFLYIKIKPFDMGYGFTNSLESILQVFVAPTQHRLGKAQINGKVHFFYSSLSPFTKDNVIINNSFDIKKNNFKFDPGVGYFSSDTILIGNKSYKVFWKNNSYDTLRCVQLLRNFKSNGFIVNQYLPKDQVLNLDETPVLFESLISRKDFIIIDFWGTWCQPCIKEIPNLKSFYNEMNKKKFKLISLAYDSDINKIKDFIKKNDMIWEHIFVNKNQHNNVLVKYNLILFPTIIVVDASGKIIFRTSINTVKEMEIFVKNLSKLNNFKNSMDIKK